MVIAGCSQCSQKAAVTVNGVVVCLAHAAIEVGKLQATDPPTIVDVLGTRMCACGAVPRFGLENKRSLACGPCARIWGVLLGGVAFACVTGSPGSSARTANACVGSACAEKAKKPVGHNITPSGKRYCATDRDAVITDEAAKDKPFDERTTFKFAPLPCPGKPCTADGCTEESVVVRAADDTAMCLAHWTALDDVEAKKAFEWTGACHKRPIYGPTFDDGNVRGPRERCGDHKLADDVNNHNSRCSVCVAALGWRWATIANRGKCGPCNGGNADQWFPLMRQSLWIGFWQRNVSLAGATITHESREKLLEEDKLSRIDTRVDRADGSVDLIEIDEGAHWDRAVCEELGRLRAVVQIPGKQVRVVRVNPDRPGKQIAAKITRGAVVRLLEEKGGQLTFDDKLAMEEVKKENLERSARLVEEARNVPPGHVVYVDYPLESPHLMVNGRALVRHPDVEIRGEDGKYADLIVVPLQLFFPL